jgi:hypothetical protein
LATARQATQFRNKLTRSIELLWPVNALTPISTCPHGVSIEPDWLCVVCHGAEESTQDAIDRMPAPPPTNPEVRLLARITHLKHWLADHPEAPPLERLCVRRRIIELDFQYTKWIATRYERREDLKGGKS